MPGDAPATMVSENKQSMVEGERIEAVNSTTTFADDATLNKGQTRSSVEVQSLGPPKVDQNSIYDFLAKPRVIQEITVSTADTVGAIIGSATLNGALYGYPPYAEKLAGYNLVRFTTVFRVVLNAMPFQQGRLLCYFIPLERDYQLSNGTYAQLHDRQNVQRTQLPNIELDFRDGAVELEIPYVAPTTHMNSGGFLDPGTFKIAILSPMKTGPAASTDCDLTVFVSFKDVELAAPIFVPQSGVKNTRTKVRRGKAKFSPILDEEEAQPGWASTALSKVADVSGALSTIPVYGDLASLVSGAANQASKLLAYFGWSKPISDKESSPFLSLPLRHFGNGSGVNTGDTFTLDPTSKMAPMKGFAGTDMDEMAFSYIKEIPANIGLFSVSTTDIHDTIIYSIDVGPSFMSFTESFVGAVCTAQGAYLPPAFYVASQCAYWRGSIIMKFKFVRTDFHSMRLLITYTPNANINPNIADSSFAMRDIIDIRSCDEHEVILPYMKNTLYENYTVSMGRLEIRVLNELKAPETVSDTVDVLVYASAGPDFEVSGFLPGRNIPFVPQSGILGSEAPLDPTLMQNAASIGDPILSIKTLINASVEMLFDEATNTTSVLQFRPFIASLATLDLSVDFLQAPQFVNGAMDSFSIFAPGYVLLRGSARVTILDESTTANPSYFTAKFCPDNRVPGSGIIQAASKALKGVIPAFRLLETAYSGIVSGRPHQSSADYVVPHLAKTQYKQIRVVTPNEPSSYFDKFDTSEMSLVVNASAPGNYKILRSGGDDLRLGYFVGFPPILASIANNI